MSSSFEEALVSHCAPTLAGHKCGNLFSWRFACAQVLGQDICHANRLLRPKGVQVRLLKCCASGALVYVYRPQRLAQRLAQADIQGFLIQQGYGDTSLNGALLTLSQHIRCCAEFPHEIGVFLDYPLADVLGFIQNKGENFCCTGCWKAYGNEAQARRTFALYRKCREVYLTCYRQKGYGVSRLTVAA